MKKLLSILSIFIAFSFTGCENSAGDPVKLLSLTGNPTYLGGDENWIIVQSETGALLEYRKFEQNDVFVLETTKNVPGSTMGVTILNYFDGDKERFELITYLQLEIGMDIKLNPLVVATDHNGAVTGNFSFTVENYPSFDNLVMANKFGKSCGGWQNFPAEQKIRVDCESVANTNKYIFQMTDGAGDIKYKILEGVAPGGTYSSDYSNLSDFDQTVNFSFPSTDDVFCVVEAREQGQSLEESGFVLNLHYHLHLLSSFKTGYLNSLPNPRTLLFLDYPTFSYYYSNIGSVPDGNITWPSIADFSITNESLQNFSSTVPPSFKSRYSTWRYPSNPDAIANWKVMSSSKSHTLAPLPTEILDLYPALRMGEFEYDNTGFSAGENVRTHAQRIATALEGSDDFSGIDITITAK